MQTNNLKVKGPRGKEIDLRSAIEVLQTFSDETVYAATLDIIFSLDLQKKEAYSAFIEALFSLIKEPGVRTRLEQSLIEQIKLLKKRQQKPDKKEEAINVESVFSEDSSKLDNLSSDLKLQLEITNYILQYFKNGDFVTVEKCLDMLLAKKVLINTVKSFIKKQVNYYIAEEDVKNLDRMAKKYGIHQELASTIREQLDGFIAKKKGN